MEQALRKLFLILIFFSVFVDNCYSSDIKRPKTEREVFFHGTNHELEVYRIYGRQDGPTMLIVGGIQGDEPGGFLSADSYADIKLEKGNLIVIPRMNFYSIMLFNREVKGVDMNRLFDKSPDDWQGDIVNKIKGYMKEADIFLNLHDGWGYHNPKHISWSVSPDRFGYSVIVDEEEYKCKDGRVLKLGEMAKTAMNAANSKIPDDDPKKHYFNTETSKSHSRFKNMRKTATWYAVSDLCIPAFGIEGSKNMVIEKNVLYHNYVINEFMKLSGIEIEYPNTHTYAPEFKGAVVQADDLELFVRNKKTVNVEKGKTVKITDIISNHKRGLTCDIVDFGNLNDINKEYTVNKNTKVIFRKDNIVMGSILLKAVDVEKVAENKPVLAERAEKPVKTNISSNEKVFLISIDDKEITVKNGDTVKVMNGSALKLLKLHKGGKVYDVNINFKGWFPPIDSAGANKGDDTGYSILFPPENILKKYSKNGAGKIYPVEAVDKRSKKKIAEIFIELE